jgi:hypothetical protein
VSNTLGLLFCPEKSIVLAKTKVLGSSLYSTNYLKDLLPLPLLLPRLSELGFPGYDELRLRGERARLKGFSNFRTAPTEISVTSPDFRSQDLPKRKPRRFLGTRVEIHSTMGEKRLISLLSVSLIVFAIFQCALLTGASPRAQQPEWRVAPSQGLLALHLASLAPS